MSRSRYRFGEGEYPYFVTCTIVAWLPVFAHPQFVKPVFDSWRHLQAHNGLQLLGYVVMENHLHAVAVAEDLPRHVHRFKAHVSREILDRMRSSGWEQFLAELRFFKAKHKKDQEYQLWQEGSHPQQLTDAERVRRKIEYMHFNPVRRGYVEDPVHWCYSSARDYAGRQGPVEVTTDWQM